MYYNQNKLRLTYKFNHTLIIPQYSKFKFKFNQLEMALKLLNILYTKNKFVNKQTLSNIELNISQEEFNNYYFKKIKNIFKCSKCLSFTFMFYKKSSLLVQICTHCGFYLIY